MWDITRAVWFCKLIHPTCFCCGYNLHIGGSVLNGVGNDLDILLLGREQTQHRKTLPIYNLFNSLGFRVVRQTLLSDRAVYTFCSGYYTVDLIPIDLGKSTSADGSAESTGRILKKLLAARCAALAENVGL